MKVGHETALFYSKKFFSNMVFPISKGIDTNSSVVTAQSGVVLEQLDQLLADHGLMVPLDLGAKGSCQIGKTNEFMGVYCRTEAA